MSGGESGGETPQLKPSGVKVRIAGEDPRCPFLWGKTKKDRDETEEN